MQNIGWPREPYDCLLEKQCDFTITGVLRCRTGVSLERIFLPAIFLRQSLHTQPRGFLSFQGLWIAVSLKCILLPVTTHCDLALRKGLESIGLGQSVRVAGWAECVIATYSVLSNQGVKRGEYGTLRKREKHRKVLCKLQILFCVFLQLFTFILSFLFWHFPIFFQACPILWESPFLGQWFSNLACIRLPGGLVIIQFAEPLL